MAVRDLLPLPLVGEPRPISPLRLAVLLSLLPPKPPDFRRTNWPRRAISIATGEMGWSGVDFPETFEGSELSSWPFRVIDNEGSLVIEDDNVGLLAVDVGVSEEGWLYIQVALNTVDAPIMNDGVMLKSNSATEAKKERTIEREVANPFRMLSEYLMTMAVIRPPRTWMATVAQAHPPKWRNKSRKNPRESGGGAA